MLVAYDQLPLHRVSEVSTIQTCIYYYSVLYCSLTLRPMDREELCERIILDPEIFSRLFLYYNVGVRGRLLRRGTGSDN